MALTSTANYDIGQFYFDGSDTRSYWTEVSNIKSYGTEDSNCSSSIKGMKLDAKISAQGADISKVNSGNVFMPMLLEFYINGDNIGEGDPTGEHIIQILGSVNSTTITSYNGMDVIAQDTVQIKRGKKTKVSLGFVPTGSYTSIVVSKYNRNSNKINLYTAIEDIKLYRLTEQVFNQLGTTNYDFVKVGIQGVPGTTFVLNGSKFIIGKSGTFELYNRNVNIYSLGIKAVQNEPFVVTYKYLPTN